MKQRKYQKRDSVRCSKCGELLEESRVGKQRYCKKCHATYMRATRPAFSELSPEAQKKVITRAYSKEYVRRGYILKKPCAVCGDEKSEMHHEDYDKPTIVIWLCRKHHLENHSNATKSNE